jgi:hypothetical protein
LSKTLPMALIESSKVTKTLRSGAAQTLLFLLCRAHPRGSGRVLPGSPPATSPGNSCTPAGPFQRRILRALTRQSRTEWRGRAKVSNELSNYRGANRQPRLDDPGSFGAAALGIDDHPACFTPKRSQPRTGGPDAAAPGVSVFGVLRRLVGAAREGKPARCGWLRGCLQC